MKILHQTEDKSNENFKYQVKETRFINSTDLVAAKYMIKEQVHSRPGGRARKDSLILYSSYLMQKTKIKLRSFTLNKLKVWRSYLEDQHTCHESDHIERN